MINAGWQNPLARFPYVLESGVEFVSKKWKEKWEKVFTDNLKGKHSAEAWTQERKNSQSREQMDRGNPKGDAGPCIRSPILRFDCKDQK